MREKEQEKINSTDDNGGRQLFEYENLTTGSIRIKTNIRDDIENESFLIDRRLIEKEADN